MVVYQLSCRAGHAFEGWYGSPDAFDREAGAGRLECPVCGISAVAKLPSAPYVHTSGSQPREAPAPAPVDPRQKVLEQLKTYILSNTENVGREFPEVARRIHYGEEAHRGIRGKATREEAEELREEGVPAYSVSPEIALDEVH